PVHARVRDLLPAGRGTQHQRDRQAPFAQLQDRRQLQHADQEQAGGQHGGGADPPRHPLQRRPGLGQAVRGPGTGTRSPARRLQSVFRKDPFSPRARVPRARSATAFPGQPFEGPPPSLQGRTRGASSEGLPVKGRPRTSTRTPQKEEGGKEPPSASAFRQGTAPCAALPGQSSTTTPQGILPTGICFTVSSFSVSMTDTVPLTPSVVNTFEPSR